MSGASVYAVEEGSPGTATPGPASVLQENAHTAWRHAREDISGSRAFKSEAEQAKLYGSGKEPHQLRQPLARVTTRNMVVDSYDSVIHVGRIPMGIIDPRTLTKRAWDTVVLLLIVCVRGRHRGTAL